MDPALRSCVQKGFYPLHDTLRCIFLQKVARILQHIRCGMRIYALPLLKHCRGKHRVSHPPDQENRQRRAFFVQLETRKATAIAAMMRYFTVCPANY